MTQETAQKTLQQVVNEKPFEDFREWWAVGTDFVKFMSVAICGQWSELPGESDLAIIDGYVNEYIKTVYQRDARENLAADFHAQSATDIESGEFDALSYAFYRSAFERIAASADSLKESVERERRLFTKRVGKSFFDQVYSKLQLDLPAGFQSEEDLTQLNGCIQRTGAFLADQGYLKTHFAFTFDVDVNHNGEAVKQSADEALNNLNANGLAHAIYEMGYPIILPSAVYLYHTLGEAQHHSSRTIEELFDRVGCEARETDDFDPIGYPSDRVVELWEIKRLASG